MGNRRGWQSLVLSPRNRQRLLRAKLAAARRLNVPVGIPQLKLVMSAPFSWETLQRALRGKPVYIPHHDFIVAWLDQHHPENGAPAARIGGKDAASGERDEEVPAWPTLPDEIAARTFRGSR